MESLKGTVERIVYHNDENHYTVARLKAQVVTLPRATGGRFRGSPELVTIVGSLPGLKVGETVVLEGEWAVHTQHGRQFIVASCQPQAPTTVEGIRRYLGSGLIKGIGPKMARAIVERFGEDTLDVIEERPELLREVPGISAARVQLITAAWVEQREIKALMLFLQSHGVSTGLAARIFKTYGADALRQVRENPYSLERDVQGVGFRTADALARKLGLPEQSLERFVAGLKYVLSQAADEGHVFLPRAELVARGAEALSCDEAALLPALGCLVEELPWGEKRDAVQDGDRVYLAALYQCEQGLARRLSRLQTTPSTLLFAGSVDWNAAALPANGAALVLAEAQREAVRAALSHKVSILTGGPGTGKTTTLRVLIGVLEHYGVPYCLTAPTGRAAKRMSEATGRPARTLHRLLEYSPGSGEFAYDEENPLPYTFVIADEASMLDIVLAYHLLKAVAPAAHLLLVGDVDQLPSVGPGNVLRDLIGAGTVPTMRLQTLFRQARQSQIIVAAHRVNAGQLPTAEVAAEGSADFFVIREEDPTRTLTLLRTVVAERIPRRFGLDPLTGVQVISPMHRGSLGVGYLNEQLQELLNPSRGAHSELSLGSRLFRVGDRVMQVRNNYDKNVFNGDMGRVAAIDRESQVVRVEYPAEGVVATAGATIPGVMREPAAAYGARRVRGRSPAAPMVRTTLLGPVVEVAYDFAELDELTLAYAISAHKAQGSEFPAVVLILTMGHYTMLQRNLLYTAITRARQLCVIIGSPRALLRAVENSTVATRYSALAARLQSAAAIATRGGRP